MDHQPIESSFESEIKIQGFPLAYDERFNIYVLLDSSFANRFIELHLGNKFLNDQCPGYSWYLHPEEALYMVSVMDPLIQKAQKNNQKIRSQSIQQIYKTAKAKDINTIHFYLNMKKKNKFLRRIDKFQLQPMEGVQEWDKKVNELKLFKLYELSEDYKMDTCFRYVMVVEPEDKIVEVVFSQFILGIKKTLNEHKLHICIFSNNDFVFMELKN